MAGMDVVAGASGAPALSPSDRRPGPGGSGRPPHDPAPVPPPANGAAPAPTVTVTTPAPDQDPRPVTARPGARVPRRAPAAALAVRELAVRSEVPVGLARADGIAIAFVPRPGSLVADVRLYAREGGGRQLVESRLVPAHGGRRTTVRLRVRAARRGAYEVTVRAGAGRRTLGPAVVARVRIR